MGDGVLHQDEAVLLAHPLLATLAEEVGARVLFLKGASAVALGVRPPRLSTDTDVLVEPAGFAPLCAALERCGWRLRVPTGTLRYAGDFAFDHSAHYIHDEWPCDLDVHYNFPGFLADPSQVFDALWARRTSVEVAGRPVPTPDVLGQSLVVGLHALRDPDQPQSRLDLDHLAGLLPTLAAADREALRDLARETGASGTAYEVLRLAGTEPHPLTAAEQARIGDWRLRQQGHGTSTARVAELVAAPWSQRPRVLREALLPSREYLVGSHLAPQLTWPQVAVLHLRRWVRGLVALPRGARVVLRQRRLR